METETSWLEHGLVWEDMMLCVVYVSCLLTPIEIFILQYIAFDSPLFIFLAVCDGLCLVDLGVAMHAKVLTPFYVELRLEQTRLEKQQAKEGGALGALGGVGALLLLQQRGGSAAAAAAAASSRAAHKIPPFHFFLRWLWSRPMPDKGKMIARFVGVLPLLSVPIAAALGLSGQACLCIYFSLPLFPSSLY